MDPIWNKRLGWLLLLAGWALTIGLDPWALSQRDLHALAGSPRMAARHAQGVVLAMGLQQLALVLLTRARERPLGRWARTFTLLGTLLYTTGYLDLALGLGPLWLIPLGAGINLLALALLLAEELRAPGSPERQIVLAIFCVGMGLDLAVGLFTADPAHFFPAFLGPEDGVRQRMLRLGRVAATALSLLLLLFQERASRADGLFAWVRAAQWGLVIGCVGMPTILAAAALLDIRLKYLLPIPALATTLGAVVGLVLAWRTARPLECWGWALIVVSVNAGLLVGLYAFDGPLPAPPTQEMYTLFPRRLVRLAHAYSIVLGMSAILLARLPAGRLATSLFVGGSCVTLAALGLLGWWPEATAVLAAGPLLIVAGLLASWWKRDPSQAP
jgi:hypothetical protein